MKYIVLHLCIAMMYLSISSKPVGSADTCPSEQDVIFNHYAKVLEEIHGEAYYPWLQAPLRKPQR